MRTASPACKLPSSKGFTLGAVKCKEGMRPDPAQPQSGSRRGCVCVLPESTHVDTQPYTRLHTRVQCSTRVCVRPGSREQGLELARHRRALMPRTALRTPCGRDR